MEGEALDLNRALWNELAAMHGKDAVYDVDAFLAGQDTLHDLEAELAGDVAGLDLLHLQCHFGMDTISWARRGARVTGVDFSPVAVDRARALAAQTGVDATFVEADTQALPADLAGRFDLVVATYGVLCWIGDLDAWMGGAAAALREGGRLILIDYHPLYGMMDKLEPLELGFDYGGGAPERFESAGSYADPDLPTTANVTIEFSHSLGEIVTAAAAAGLTVTRLLEPPDADHDGRGLAVKGADGRHRVEVQGRWIPIVYALTARR